MQKRVNYPEWTLTPWDGNPSLNLQCWRKSFFGGYVSVGVGEFDTVSFSYGANSDASFSSTRWRKNRVIPEQEMMNAIDEHAKKYPSRFDWIKLKIN